ncbi:MAG TPA: FAD-binding oxidoreductase [Myxococcales bacterium]|nr:FAD-binding oxidoreductase [Myxococcales bacterium]
MQDRSEIQAAFAPLAAVPDSHAARVQAIADQVKSRGAGRRLTIRKAHPGHTPHDLGYKAGCHPVMVDGLDRELIIDRDALTATVEGQVNLRRLCKEALAAGTMPKVVPEFETFTVAGLVNGLGIETSSHRHGVFPASAVSLEVVLGNGEVIEASAARHADLLATLPGSYGTLGIVTRATVQLREAKPFVRSHYRHFTRLAEYGAAFRAALRDHEFVEGFVIARDSYVLVTSEYSDAVSDLDVFEAMQPGNPWYYRHAEALARGEGEDLVPSYSYMFRHQRSLLWLAPIIAGSNPLMSTRFGREMLAKMVERKVAKDGFQVNMPVELQERCLVNQDMGVRLSRLEEGIEYVQRNLDVHPLWNCPAGSGTTALSFAMPRRLQREPEMVVDIGVYGEPKVKHYRPYDAMRALQKFVDVPSFWGVCYLSNEELREIYDFEAYQAVQRKYHAADAFVPLERKLRFMKPSEVPQERLPLWRLARLWYDLTA